MPDAANRARILLLIKGLGVGGAERLLEASLPHLDRDRYAYQVAYLLPWKAALAPAFRAAGVPVHDLGMRVPADPRALRRLVALLRRERIDLVHAHLPVAGIWGRVAARLAGVRHVVYTEHNVPARYALPTRLLNRHTYRLTDIVIAVSEEVRRAVAGYANGRPAIVTVTNAVDADALAAVPVERDAVRREFAFPADALLVTTVGNLTPKKGHAFLLAAAREVLRREPLARFLLVGQGPLDETLRAEAQRLGLGERFVFAGFRADAVRLVAASDLFVLSSLHEGLPVALLEAMALAKPTVVTRVGGVPEATDETSSILVPPGDAQALASAITEVLRSPGRRAEMGSSARAKARARYGVPHMVRQIEAVYARLLAGPAS
jgi:glycosyltransferase involved in cell wall biosynthesis